MTTIIIDSKTKAIYADSQITATETSVSSNMVFPNNEFKVTTLQPDTEKVFYISKEVGWIAATGCMKMLSKCVHLSKKNNKFTLPDISEGYNDVIIINVVFGGGKVDVIEYTPDTKRRYYMINKRFWNNRWVRLDTGLLFYGSGQYYAIGAYRVCNDPIQSIIAASECDQYTNANVKTYKLQD